MLLSMQPANAECVAEMEPINFGTIDILNPGRVATRANITVTCTRTAWLTSQSFNICLAVDGGKAVSARDITPRHMCPDGSCSGHRNKLPFNLYSDAGHNTIWGSSLYGTPTINTVITIPYSLSHYTKSITLPIYAELLPPPKNLPPGEYLNRFTGGSTALYYKDASEGTANACNSPNFSRFDFEVSAQIKKNCTVNIPNDINLGAVEANATNIAGQTNLQVACTQNTPYYIGLKPSNGNNNGAGRMKSTRPSANTDQIPYQLRSSSEMNGRIWGNTATEKSVGNGVGSTGNGQIQTHTIYATVPSANYKPDEYKDTVTVQVNY